MVTASLILAVGLIMVAVLLQWKEKRGWASEQCSPRTYRQMPPNKDAYREAGFDPYALLEEAAQEKKSLAVNIPGSTNPYQPPSSDLLDTENMSASSIDQQYYSRRRQARSWVHAIIASCGGLIVIGTLGGGTLWVLAWFLVMLALVLVIFLAGLDAYRTLCYHRAKLPEVRRQFLIEE